MKPGVTNFRKVVLVGAVLLVGFCCITCNLRSEVLVGVMRESESGVSNIRFDGEFLRQANFSVWVGRHEITFEAGSRKHGFVVEIGRGESYLFPRSHDPFLEVDGDVKIVAVKPVERTGGRDNFQ